MKTDWNWIAKLLNNNVPSNGEKYEEKKKKKQKKKPQQIAHQFVQWTTLLSIFNQLYYTVHRCMRQYTRGTGTQSTKYLRIKQKQRAQ